MKKFITIISTLVLLGIAAYGGWRYHNKIQQTNASQPVQKAVSSTSQVQQSQTTPTHSAKYLVIKEWNVKFQLPDNLSDATYAYSSNNAVYLTTAGIEKIPGCSKQTAIVLERGQGDDPIGPSTVNELLAGNPSTLKKAGDYYYALIVGSLGCANSASPEQQAYFRSVSDAFQDAKNNLEISGAN